MTDETSGRDFADINDALADFGDGGDAPADDAATGDGGGGGGADGGAVEEPELDQDQLDAIEEAQRAMTDARQRLAEVPAEVVVTNHVMGLYELAAIHLSSTPPDLVQAMLAIDSVAYLVEGLGDRLGDDAPTLRDALNNIRLAFVQIKNSLNETPDARSD